MDAGLYLTEPGSGGRTRIQPRTCVQQWHFADENRPVSSSLKCMSPCASRGRRDGEARGGVGHGPECMT